MALPDLRRRWKELRNSHSFEEGEAEPFQSLTGRGDYCFFWMNCFLKGKADWNPELSFESIHAAVSYPQC